jgi:pentatricopeptide repeat protein
MTPGCDGGGGGCSVSTTFVHKLASSGDFESARRLIDKMAKFGCVPNVVVYIALPDGVCSFGDVDAAPRLVEEMEDANSVQAAHPTWWPIPLWERKVGEDTWRAG